MGGVHVQWANESTLLYQCQHLLGYNLTNRNTRDEEARFQQLCLKVTTYPLFTVATYSNNQSTVLE